MTRGVTRYCTGFTAIVDERVDLLGDAHRAELGGHAGAGARGDDDRREHRRQLARDGDAERGADEALGAELPQRRGQLQREDHADEERRSCDTISSDCTPM